jgi:hypothetical protein
MISKTKAATKIAVALLLGVSSVFATAAFAEAKVCRGTFVVARYNTGVQYSCEGDTCKSYRYVDEHGVQHDLGCEARDSPDLAFVK